MICKKCGGTVETRQTEAHELIYYCAQCDSIVAVTK